MLYKPNSCMSDISLCVLVLHGKLHSHNHHPVGEET